MAIEEIPKPKARVRLEELVACSEKRIERARAKLRAAQEEVERAETALDRDRAELAEWLEQNPDAQPLLI